MMSLMETIRAVSAGAHDSRYAGPAVRQTTAHRKVMDSPDRTRWWNRAPQPGTGYSDSLLAAATAAFLLIEDAPDT